VSARSSGAASALRSWWPSTHSPAAASAVAKATAAPGCRARSRSSSWPTYPEAPSTPTGTFALLFIAPEKYAALVGTQGPPLHGAKRSLPPFEPRVGPVRPPHLPARLAFHAHHVGGEVEAALEQARSHAVHVHGHLLLFELADLLDVEAARHDDFHVLEAFVVERLAHVPDEPRVDAGRLERPHLRDHRPVHKRLGGVDPHAVQALAEGARHLERGADAVVLEIDERDQAHAVGHVLGKLLRGEHRVAPVGRDDGVWHSADY